MKKVVQIITLMLLLSTTSYSATHVINSLPYTFSASSLTPGEVDTLVLGASKLTSATNGILLTAVYGIELTDVVLNLDQDTIVFGTAGGDNNYGVRVTGTAAYWPHDMKVVGGYILHEPSDTTAERNYCLNITGNNLLIEDVNAVIRGYNSKAFISSGPFVYDNILRGGTFRSEVTGYNSRCNFDAAVVSVYDLRQQTLIDNNAQRHYTIENITINGGPHAGLTVHGRVGGDRATAIIRNNYIMTDARNDFYLTYSGTCLSSSNPYGIVSSGLTGGSLIYNNTIVSGTQYGGNRGILMEGAQGTPGNPIIVRKNHVEVNEGPNVEYGDGLPVHAFRIRYGPGYVLVDSNTFISRGDNNPATTNLGNQVHAIRCSSGIPGETNVIFKHNTIRAISQSPSGVNCNALTFDAVEYDSLFFTYYNNISSSGNVYKFGEGNGHSYGQVLEGDTVSFESTTINPITYHVGHLGNNFICDGNIAKDITHLGGTSYNDIYFSLAGTEDITMKKTIGIQVKGNNGFNVSGASVSVVNNYGNAVLNGFTDSTGSIEGALSYWFESRTLTDSTAYNNFSLVVEKGTDIYTTDMVVGAETNAVKICTLSNTAGEIDSIPPDPIDDLSCIPGSNDGQIYMTWTAVGDDANSGSASSYQVKYSTSTITEQNFDTLTTVYASTPDPAVAGSAEAMTMSGLTPGTVYYVAMKVYDYAGNSSALSNVSSAEAFLDLGSGGEDDTTYVSESLLPQAGAVLLASQPTLSAENITAPGTNNYYFEVAEDNSFASLVTASAPIAENPSGTTTWQIDTALTPGQSYYWRVQVNGYGYSAVSDFSIQAPSAVASTQIIAYPNPVNFRNNEWVTFDLPDAESVNLLIYTVSGETVLLLQDQVGDYLWYGKNQSGNQVATHQTYLWSVSYGSESYQGKIVVIQ